MNYGYFVQWKLVTKKGRLESQARNRQSQCRLASYGGYIRELFKIL